MFREKFCGHLMTIVRQGGMRPEDIEKAISYSWTHGASLALYLPHEAYNEVGERGRVAFATFILEGVVRRWFEEVGESNPSDDEIEEGLAELVPREESMPMTRLSTEEGWMIGKRSIN